MVEVALKSIGPGVACVRFQIPVLQLNSSFGKVILSCASVSY